MGAAAFTGFLTRTGDGRGAYWNGEFATWDDLLAAGRRRGADLRAQRAYAVDPTAGLESLVSLFAVLTTPETMLLWAPVAELGIAATPIAPALSEVDNPLPGALDRPRYGLCTSGTSGAPKVVLGHSDTWGQLALYYERALFGELFGGRQPSTLASALPPRYSATFFGSVLPALYLRRDLRVLAAHDWTPVQQLAATEPVLVQAVPALTAAACLGTPEPVDMRHAVLLLGGGHLSAERVALINERFTGALVTNIYGTSEAGGVAVDLAPGHNQHVGRPLPGRPVWLVDVDERGVGRIATTGPDCCTHVWRVGEEPEPLPGYVATTDYGRFDDAGNLCLEGRIDGAEKLMGLLVYPRGIERHLLALPGVTDARVQVERTAAGLERLHARIVGTIDEAAVRAHCATLPEAQRPTRIEYVTEADLLATYGASGKL